MADKQILELPIADLATLKSGKDLSFIAQIEGYDLDFQIKPDILAAYFSFLAQGQSSGSGLSRSKIAVTTSINSLTIPWNAAAVSAYGNDPTILYYYIAYKDSVSGLYTNRYVQPQITKSGSGYSVYLNWDDNLDGNLIIL